ncbi:hypothetical protein ASD86_00405 [Lysobacter sp. Root690]|nr:hypothetical protein ASD86_00405 [Lysobacter sp. Root690]
MTRAHWLLFVAMLVTVLIYAVGLDGPYLFDDTFNLMPVRQWAAGRLGWNEVMFGNVSGVLGRPVSMASFMLSAALGNATPLDFKLGNLLIHIACAALIYMLLLRLFLRSSTTRSIGATTAGFLTALWLLHPLHVSTVLYAVQRMAQLSSLFVLAALLAYLQGRNALDARARTKAYVWLFVGFPLLWLLGLLSKENAAVAPALCLVVELAYFQRLPELRRALAGFYGLTLITPALLALMVLIVKPGALLAGYAIRDFDMTERLLSQTRALLDYLGMLLFPRGERMGVFTDDFAVSHGLLSPPSTLACLCALSAISAIAIVLRRRSPHLFAGWFFFLVAHGVESTVLPLELYFEHRNYLPSVGLLLMLAGMLSLSRESVRATGAYRYGMSMAALVAAALLASITWQQAGVWRSKEAIVEQAVRSHPGSLRAVQAKMIAAINRRRYEQATALISPMSRSADARTRLLSHLDMISISCLAGRPADPTWLQRSVADARPKLTIAEIQSVALLMQVSRDDGCHGLSQQQIADAIVAIADAATAQSDAIWPKAQLRYAAALIYGRIEHWPQALPQARLAAQPKAQAEVTALLIQALAHTGQRTEADRQLQSLSSRISPDDKPGQAALKIAREAIEVSTQATPQNRETNPS